MRLVCLTIILTACAITPDEEEPDESDDVEALAGDGLPQCPGVTRSITTYRGLGGTYARVGLPVAGEPTRLQLIPLRDDPDAVGSFVGVRSGLFYLGAFRAIPDNPAIGAAIAFDIGGDGRFDESLFVLGTKRDGLGRISALCLAGQQPFLMTRLF